jgi:GAF domain-containing protein
MASATQQDFGAYRTAFGRGTQVQQVHTWLSAFDKERRRQDAVDQSGALDLCGAPELQRIVDLAAAHYGTRFAAVSVIHRRTQVLLAEHGLGVQETTRDTAFCAVAIQQPDAPLIVPDALQDARFANYATVVSAPFLRFYAGVPVLDGEGQPLGTLCVADSEPRTAAFDPTLLTIMAHEAERVVRRCADESDAA